MSSTSSAVHRTPPPVKPRIIPPERRDILEAPCELCAHIRWVRFDDGLCKPCRTFTDQVHAADAARRLTAGPRPEVPW